MTLATKLAHKPNDWVGYLSRQDVLEFRALFGDAVTHKSGGEAHKWIMARVSTGWPHNHEYV